MTLKDELLTMRNAKFDEEKQRRINDIHNAAMEVLETLENTIKTKSRSGDYTETNSINRISGTFYFSSVDMDTCEGWVTRRLSKIPIRIIQYKKKNYFLKGEIGAKIIIDFTPELKEVLTEIKKTAQNKGIMISNFFVVSKDSMEKQYTGPFYTEAPPIKGIYPSSLDMRDRAFCNNQTTLNNAIMYCLDIGFDYSIAF
ncbi:MAG: hypothetical protein Q4C46_02935 [Bacillota bacterium]|nr:hypothetical protein [Bacillota bacterium]